MSAPPPPSTSPLPPTFPRAVDGVKELQCVEPAMEYLKVPAKYVSKYFAPPSFTGKVGVEWDADGWMHGGSRVCVGGALCIESGDEKPPRSWCLAPATALAEADAPLRASAWAACCTALGDRGSRQGLPPALTPLVGVPTPAPPSRACCAGVRADKGLWDCDQLDPGCV